MQLNQHTGLRPRGGAFDRGLPRTRLAPSARTGRAPEDGPPERTQDTPRSVRGRYIPALDGLRALAVCAVIAYHLGYRWARGGYLGVDLFFVLSGFLITGLLVEERIAVGGIRLGAFWARRAKRLLPGLLVMLVGVCAFLALAGSGVGSSLEKIRGDVLSTVFYFANWHLLLSGQPYFGQFGTPSPFDHTWSLAIEEQFYLVWPMILVAVVGLRSARTADTATTCAPHSAAHETWRKRGIFVCLLGAALSAAWMAVLSHRGANINRLYYGTDTRAFDLMVGALLAFAVSARRQPTSSNRRRLHLVGGLGVVGMALFIAYAGAADAAPRWMFEGGFLLFALCAAGTIADVRQLGSGPLATWLSLRPIRWVGRISYGLYLWHWPVIVELSQTRTGLSGLELDALRVGVTFVAATLSYYAIERPLRRASWGRAPRAVRLSAAPLGMAAAAVVGFVATTPAAASQAAPTIALGSPARVPGAGGLSAQPPIRLPAAAPSATRPIRVLLIGDSVMFVDAPAVQAALGSTRAVTVADDSFPGWGLSTDPNWRRDVTKAVLDARPDLVVCMWSWDNGVAVSDPTGYSSELARFVRVVLDPANGVRGVVFQQFPTPGPVISAVNAAQAASETRADASGVSAWNSIAARQVRLFPGRVMYFPIGPAVELNGRFSAWLPPGPRNAPTSDWVRVRMIDNLHLCPAGAARYADALLSDMTTLFRIPPAAPGWSTGSWTRDPRYQTAVGFSGSPCPDDHPTT